MKRHVHSFTFVREQKLIVCLADKSANTDAIDTRPVSPPNKWKCTAVLVRDERFNVLNSSLVKCNFGVSRENDLIPVVCLTGM